LANGLANTSIPKYLNTNKISRPLLFQIKYVADADGGFRILEGSTLEGMRPKDTAAVRKAKEEHEVLFKMIALRNQEVPVVAEAVQPQETRAVQQKRRQHADLFQRIAEEHRLVAEEHKRLADLHSRQASS
jgi:hypothetical protein